MTFDGKTAIQPNSVVGPQDSNIEAGDPLGVFYSGKSAVLGTYPDHAYLGQVAFAPLLGGDRDQLVFSGTYVDPGDIQGILVVVSFRDGTARIVYSWEGDTGLGLWHISHNIIRAEANYMPSWTAIASPVRTYHFAIGSRAGRMVEVYDDRPFLGIVLGYAPTRPVVDRRNTLPRPVVVLTSPNGPAAGLLRPGDLILSVEDAPRMSGYNGSSPFSVGPGSRSTLKYSLREMISNFHAGQSARFLIQRGSKRLTVRVKLGSLMAPAASVIRTPTTNGSEGAL